MRYIMVSSILNKTYYRIYDTNILLKSTLTTTNFNTLRKCIENNTLEYMQANKITGDLVFEFNALEEFENKFMEYLV